MRFLSFICVLLLCSASYSQDKEVQKPYKVWYVAAGPSLPILGSEDKRSSVFLGYQSVRPEKRLTLNHRNINLVIEYNASFSVGGGWEDRPHDSYASIAVLGIARIEALGPSGNGTYWDAGFGLLLTNNNTFDLDSRVNSTPVIGGGWILPWGRNLMQVGFRAYHISNAGTRGPNQGQNQLLLQVGVRY